MRYRPWGGRFTFRGPGWPGGVNATSGGRKLNGDVGESPCEGGYGPDVDRVRPTITNPHLGYRSLEKHTISSVSRFHGRSSRLGSEQPIDEALRVVDDPRRRCLRERHHRIDDAARGTLRMVHEHLAIILARKEARLEDHRDRHGMEGVLVPAEVERVVVPHAASGRRQAFNACRLSAAPRPDTRRSWGRYSRLHELR